MPETKHRTNKEEKKKKHTTKYFITTVHRLSCELNDVVLSWKKIKCDHVKD